MSEMRPCHETRLQAVPRLLPAVIVSTEVREGDRAKQKRRWDRENAWRWYDECPTCDGYKAKKSKRCRKCRPYKHDENGIPAKAYVDLP